ncbi:MAG: hypothetical protein U1A16_01640 [Patescibacteria group bacterium]|nr:hypothetical protein [Patescibacteria group bacterium]
MAAGESFAKTFLRGEAQYGFWNVLAKTLGFVNTIVIISSLTVYQYGVFQLLLVLYGFFSDLTAVGEGVIVTDMTRLGGDSDQSRAKRLFYEYTGFRLIMGVLLWAVFFFGASLLQFRYSADFLAFFRILSFLFLIDALTIALTTLFRLHLRFGLIALRMAVAKAGQLTLMSYFFLVGHVDQREVIIALVVGAAASLAVLIPAASKQFGSWRAVGIGTAWMLPAIAARHGKWEFSRHIVSRLSARLQAWLIKIFIGTEAVGIYALARTMVEVLENLLSSNTLGTLVARRLTFGRGLEKIFVYGTKYFVLASTVSMIVGWAAAPLAVHFFFPDYTLAVGLFYLFSLEVPLHALLRMVDTFLIALRKQKFIFMRTVAKTVGLAGLMVVLMPLFGLEGVAVAEVALVGFTALSSYFYFVRRAPRYRLRLHPFMRFGQDDRMILRLMYRGLLRPFRHLYGK